MSVPLDNLYHWVNGLMPGPAILYVFHPHGSKKISDLRWLKDYDSETAWQSISVIMHDQEPLDWNLYNNLDQYIKQLPNTAPEIKKFHAKYCANYNLKAATIGTCDPIYGQVILINSEKNSNDLEKYQQNGFTCVHYWAHAVIARDWYRYAEHDTRLCSNSKPQNKFLIYCRDWSHRREYRLKFLEMLSKNQLIHTSQTSFMHVNSEGLHFSQHQFKNFNFKLDSVDLIDNLQDNKHSSTVSADYEPSDFVNTELSVILETVFDDARIHLTEKTLKPIACGHPFILAAGPGALEYIRSYGFRTFAPWIDESYDQETDSMKRLKKIIESMKKIQLLQGPELEQFSIAVKSIAEYNKLHFFSDEFFHFLQTELKNNLDLAYKQIEKSQVKNYIKWLRLVKQNRILGSLKRRRAKTRYFRQFQQSYPCDQSNQ
jgi:hypothetical protein